MGFLTGANGEKSSKRLVGMGYAVLGIIIVLADVFIEGSEAKFDILLLVVSVSLTSLGISSLEYFSKNGITPPPGTPPKEDDPDN